MDTRRFTTLDAMIVVCAVAVGLGSLLAMSPKADWAGILGRVATPSEWSVVSASGHMTDLISFATPMAISATLATLALRLIGPRPGWRRLARRPGWIACLAPIPAWGFGAALAASVAPGDEFPWRDSPSLWLEDFSLAASTLGGFAVAVAWATLILTRRWRPDPTWVDRLGRLVGASWLALAVLVVYSLYWRAI